MATKANESRNFADDLGVLDAKGTCQLETSGGKLNSENTPSESRSKDSQEEDLRLPQVVESEKIPANNRTESKVKGAPIGHSPHSIQSRINLLAISLKTFFSGLFHPSKLHPKIFSRFYRVVSLFGIFIIIVGYFWLRYSSRKISDGQPTSSHSATNQDSVVLPKHLETSGCDLIMMNDLIRQEFLSSSDHSVRLRIYDCLNMTGRFVDRERFSKDHDSEDLRIYGRISDFIVGIKAGQHKVRDCKKLEMTANCLDSIQRDYVKRSKKLTEAISDKTNKRELFVSAIYLFKANDELNVGNSKGFQKYLIEALKYTPKYLTGLQSAILTWAQTKLLVSGDIAIARQLNQSHKKVLENEKEIYAWGARFLYLYSYSEKREQLVSLAFSRVGLIQLVKSPVMLEILLPEAMKLGMSRDFLTQLDFIREFYQTNDGKENELGEKMILWKARVLAFLGEYKLAEELLGSWFKAGLPVTSDFWFVRGVIAANRSNPKDSGLFYKKSDELGMRHWSLSWNRSLAAAQVGQKGLAQKFLGEFRRYPYIEAKEKEAWGLLIEAEISWFFRDDRGSYNAVKRFLRVNPAHLRGWELLSEASARLGRRSESVKARMKVDELRGQLRYYVSDRYLYAPNGPLAGLR